jgi:hypothetical protein
MKTLKIILPLVFRLILALAIFMITSELNLKFIYWLIAGHNAFYASLLAISCLVILIAVNYKVFDKLIGWK